MTPTNIFFPIWTIFICYTRSRNW